jgi:hypothetical protein
LIGRISVCVGLFLKEKEFLGNKAISVFNTVLKEKSYDTRPFKDALALIALYVTYAFKSGMKLEYILRMLHLAMPSFEGNTLVFNSFDFNRIGSQIRQMILTNVPKVELSYGRNLNLIIEKVSETFVSKLHSIRNRI